MSEHNPEEGQGSEGNQPASTEGEGKALGIAGNIAQQFINNPITLLLILATLGVGVVGLLFTPRQEDPTISVPMVDISVKYPGASAEQVANMVTDPLERIMSEVPGVKHVYSRTRQGAATVTVRFYVGEEMGDSVVKVHDKIQSNQDKIPPGVAQPLVKPVSVDDVPIINISLWSEEVDDVALRKLGLEVLQRLEEVPKTGDGFVKGGRRERIRVDLRPGLLSAYEVSPAKIARTIRAANSKVPAGEIESEGRAYTVYTGSFLHGARDVAKLIVGSQGGEPIYLRDVAKISRGSEEASRLVEFITGPAWGENKPETGGASAVTVAIAKKSGSNGVTVARDILDKLELLKGRLLPDNVQATVTRNYGQTANQKVNELLGALFEAAIAVAVLCLIGLGLRASFVVITVIPIVVLVTVWSAWVLGYTIDRVSLFALVFAIGILVDDATVVVENIFRRWLGSGRTDTATALDAVREVGNPTVLATLTIIAALLPMGFVRGLMGPYMEPIPVLGSAAMFFSLLAAFIFTPWMAMRVRPSLMALKRAEHKEQRLRQNIARFYRPIMHPLLASSPLRWGFLGVLVAATLFSCAMFYFQWVPVKMLPFSNKPTYNVVINMPEGTSLTRTANVTRRLAEEVREVPEVRALQSYVGTSTPFDFNGMVRHYYMRKQPWQADINVTLLNKHKRERGSHAIAVATREKLTPIAERMGARIQVVEMPPGPPVRQTVVAEVYGKNPGVRREFSRDLTGMFEKVPNIVDEDNYLAAPHTQWHFVINRDKAQRRGISVKKINRNIRLLLGRGKVGDVKRGVTLEPTNIVVQVPLASRSQVQTLASVPITNARGKSIPLGELGHFEEEWVDPVIYHKDLRPVEYVTGEMQGRLGAPIYGMLTVEDMLADYTAPDGVKVSGMPGGLIGPPKTDTQTDIKWAGAWTVTYETFRDMGMAFAVALILIYGLIVWEFRDFGKALLIMGPIPLTLLGVVPGHWLLGAKWTATSMIGFIALAGIIVRHSILLVSFVQNECARGKGIEDAVVAAGEIRIRPILITSLTLMAGAAAILSDPIFKGMAVSLLFGAAVATVLSLVVIPLGCITAAGRFVGFPDGNGGAATASGPAGPQDPQSDLEEARGGPSMGQRLLNLLWRLGIALFRSLQVAGALLLAAFAWLYQRIRDAWPSGGGPPDGGPGGGKGKGRGDDEGGRPSASGDTPAEGAPTAEDGEDGDVPQSRGEKEALDGSSEDEAGESSSNPNQESIAPESTGDEASREETAEDQPQAPTGSGGYPTDHGDSSGTSRPSGARKRRGIQINPDLTEDGSDSGHGEGS